MVGSTSTALLDTEDRAGVLQAERAFRVMGTDAHVLVWQEHDPFVEPTALLDLAESELRRLELLWSRFEPDSDVGRVNREGGRPTPVSRETYELVELALRAQLFTDGRFDPTLLYELEDAGYDRSFEQMDADEPIGPPRRGVRHRARGGDADVGRRIRVDPVNLTVACPPGRGLDLGGIGKGRAADAVTAHLLLEGARGACVNLGGDLRVLGEGPGVGGITVGVENPFGGDEDLATISVRNAAVVTTARTRRHWTTPTGTAHHLLDPATGLPSSSGLASVTVIGPTAAWAEVLAKAAFLAGPTEAVTVLRRAGLPGLLVDDDHHLIRAAGFERYER